MAETENSAPAKFDKDALREWYTLAEIAERWTKLTGHDLKDIDVLHQAYTHNVSVQRSHLLN
ncbi:MAG TPA: hypothetical protein VMV35_05850 [Halothiobacillus sp.]|nr:hypothetical protein [Halothiobacillus sp.]